MADDDDAIETIVVTATRTPTPRDQVLADVTVIEREEIARAGPEGLAALLARQPGVEIVRNGGPGSVTSMFLRGSNRGQTVVLIDGVRIGSSTTGAATLEAIPLERIDRIEILRGPASGLYGADAIGGVIQVFTRNPGGALTAHANVGLGNHETRTVGGGISGTAGPLRFAVEAGHRRSGGFNAIDDPRDFSYNPDRDGYADDSVLARLAWPWADGHEVQVSALRDRLNAAYDAGQDFDDRTITVLSTWQVQSLDRLTSQWQSRLAVAESDDDSLSRSGSGDFPYRTRQRQYTWQHDLTFDKLGAVLGVERREERLTTDADFAVTARDTDAAFAIVQARSDRHEGQANIRRDHIDQIGGRTTGGAAYGYRATETLRLRLAANTAFKLPTFNDLYYPDFSNPDLKPETARNIEAGLAWSGALAVAGAPLAVSASAAGYRNRVRDLIVFQCDADFNCLPNNVATATLEGLTLVADARRRDTALHLSLDFQNPRDDDTGRLLPRRSHTHGVVSVTQGVGPMTVTVELQAASRRFDDAENTRPLAGYGVLNLAWQWQIDRAWSLLVRGDNLFDRDVRLATQYPTGGASVFAALRWSR